MGDRRPERRHARFAGVADAPTPAQVVAVEPPETAQVVAVEPLPWDQRLARTITCFLKGTDCPGRGRVYAKYTRGELGGWDYVYVAAVLTIVVAMWKGEQLLGKALLPTLSVSTIVLLTSLHFSTSKNRERCHERAPRRGSSLTMALLVMAAQWAFFRLFPSKRIRPVYMALDILLAGILSWMPALIDMDVSPQLAPIVLGVSVVLKLLMRFHRPTKAGSLGTLVLVLLVVDFVTKTLYDPLGTSLWLRMGDRTLVSC